MSFSDSFKSSVLEARLAKSQVMVVYDPERRYRDVCLEMASDKRAVVDSSESSITSRAEAIANLGKLGDHQIEQLLVYVPAPKPLEDEDKQKDPFALYGVCGDVFPSGDGDNYLSLCLKAKPDHATQVRAVFDQDPNPSFSVIDAIGGGLNWPNLRALLKVESTTDILLALLAPKDFQQDALKENRSWVSEVKDLLIASLGLKLKTKGKSWSPISDELWRYILFSEFAYDLPVKLPANLEDVPRADKNAQLLIEDLCDRLRSDNRTQSIYIQNAEAIEQSFDLPNYCSHIIDLGERDTFLFEERTFLQRAIEAFGTDDSDQIKSILERHASSVWTAVGESQAQWDLVRAAQILIESCDDVERALPEFSKGLGQLIEFYVSQMRETDRSHREFEQAVSDYEWQDIEGVMQQVIKRARAKYAALSEKLQLLFTKYVQHDGWPTTTYLSNNDVFDKLVAPKLQESGVRVAYLMVDALRYELGVALERQLASDGKLNIQPALAQLPSITLVGMAGLLPGAGDELTLTKEEGGYKPFIRGKAVATVSQRMELIRKLYGQRFQEGRLEDFVRNRFAVNEDAELLVLRSVEIDSHFENHPDTAPAEISNALKRIRVAVNKLRDLSFDEVVIATDHGFFMNTHAGAGDTCPKMPGDWLNEHQRCLLGSGEGDGNHFVLKLRKQVFAGISNGSLVLFRWHRIRQECFTIMADSHYRECVVPVITMQLGSVEQEPISQASVSLKYKNGAKVITTRLPVIELSLDTHDMFSVDSDFEILLEAHDKKSNVVGEAKPGAAVKAATGTITLRPGAIINITLKMQLEFEGRFKVKALNPTTMVEYASLDLETDYTV